MKKILFIIPALTTGGTNSSLESLYSAIKSSYDISVFSISHQPCCHNYSFTEVLMPQDEWLSYIYSDFSSQTGYRKIKAAFVKGMRFFYRLFGKELGILRWQHIANIISNYNFDYVVAFQEGEVTKLTSFVPVPNKIAWIHCNYNYYLPNDKTEEELYKKFSKIVCVSNYTANIFQERYPYLAERVTAIHNFIDGKKIRQLCKEPIMDMDLSDNCSIILSVGRIDAIKRFRFIPQIAAKIKEIKPIKFRWYIIGPQCDPFELKTLENNILDNKVADCVTWLGPKSNSYPYFKASDIYVCTSESEACPMVFLEAKFFGIPIITTDFPSAYEFVGDKEGVICDINNLAEEICKLLDDNRRKSHDYINEIRNNIESIHQLFV